MNELKDKRILIFQQRNWGRGIGQFLAKKLQAEGCVLAALTFKRTTHQFFLDQTDVKYDMLLSHDEVMSDPAAYLRGEKYSLAEICQAMGVDSVWPFVMSMRHLTRSYADKFWFGFKQNATDEQIISYIMATYKQLLALLDEFKPDIIIVPNFVILPHIMLNFLAQKSNIPMVALTDPRIKGYVIATHDYRESSGPFFERIQALSAGQAETKNRGAAQEYIEQFRQHFDKPVLPTHFDVKLNFWRKVRAELSPYHKILLWYVRRPINYLKNVGITIDYRPPRIIMRDHYAKKRYIRFMNSFAYPSFDAIDKFVYFPLQAQPEATIDVGAPYFSNQIETARLVAMSLPNDYTLVVKEHPAMVGLRPPSYIKKLARTVNVKLVDYRIPSETLLKKCDLVISPNGTTLMEAAFYRKPAIQLGHLGTTLRLPNVVRHTDMTTLAPRIKEALGMDVASKEYDRLLENYIAAVYDTGCKLNYYGVWERGEKDNMETLWQFFRNEILNVCS